MRQSKTLLVSYPTISYQPTDRPGQPTNYSVVIPQEERPSIKGRKMHSELCVFVVIFLLHGKDMVWIWNAMVAF